MNENSIALSDEHLQQAIDGTIAHRTTSCVLRHGNVVCSCAPNPSPYLLCESGECGVTRHDYDGERPVHGGNAAGGIYGWEQLYQCARCGWTRRFGLDRQPRLDVAGAAA